MDAGGLTAPRGPASSPSPQRARRACALAAVALGAVWVAWLGWRYQGMGDYPNDYAPAMTALLAGHVGAFFAHLPLNGAGGSLLLRAPAALIGKLLVGGQLAVFRFGALPCALAAGLLGLLLARRQRRAGDPVAWRAATICICVLTPAVLDAVLFGHPEEPLGAVLCVAAVLLATYGRGGLAGVALGLAIINKPWGVLAVGPVLLAARDGRVRCSATAGAICAAWGVAAYIAAPDHFGQIVLGASTSVVAHPVDLWWPLARAHTAPGVELAYFPPAWVSAHARELAVALALPLSLIVLRRRRRTCADCLALLALLFLLRCLLDPSNHVYYQVPLIYALVAWEAGAGRARGGEARAAARLWAPVGAPAAATARPPLLALWALGGFFLVFHTVSATGSLTAQFIAYLAVALPLLVLLLLAVMRGPPRARLAAEAALWPGQPARRGAMQRPGLAGYRPAA